MDGPQTPQNFVHALDVLPDMALDAADDAGADEAGAEDPPPAEDDWQSTGQLISFSPGPPPQIGGYAPSQMPLPHSYWAHGAPEEAPPVDDPPPPGPTVIVPPASDEAGGGVQSCGHVD